MTNPSESVEYKVLCEQVRLIYRQGPTLAAGAGTAAVMIAMFLWHELPSGALLLWLAAVFCSSLMRVGLFRRYWIAREGRYRAELWGALFAWGSFFSGVVWGFWPVLFYSVYSPEYSLLISTVFAGMVAVLATSGSVYLPAFYAFAIPLVLPLSVFHVFSGVQFLVWTGWLMVMFFFVNLLLASRGNRHYRELIEARFRNTELMDQLSGEKQVAENAVIAKNRFIAAASHDLRQPLHAMSLFTAALSHTNTDSRQSSIVSDIEKSMIALNQMFTSLLDVSRLEANTVDVDCRSFELQPLLDVLSTDFNGEATCRFLDLDIQRSDCTLHTDPILLERILRNLLGNALRYTHAGQVRVGVEEDDSSLDTADRPSVWLRVEDTGVGIAANELHNIFNEYHQIEPSMEEAQRGLGLGLSIVRRLCDLLKLHIEVRSHPGLGTCFSIRVPMGLIENVAQVPAMMPISNQMAAVVLVIDDEQAILSATRSMLEDWGCVVLTASTASETLSAIATAPVAPQLVLSDYQLQKGESGIDIVETVRDWLAEDLPAIIVTGDTSPERLAEVADSGLIILHKPILADELKLSIQHALAS